MLRPTIAGFLMMTAVASAAVKPAVEFFPLSDVRLLDGPFQRNMGASRGYLLSLDADRLLAGFRANAGLPEKAKRYGGWENRGLSGQTLGHYLSALSLMVASTGDEACRKKLDYAVSEFAECQAAAAVGFLAGMPNGNDIFDRIERADLGNRGGFDLNGAWVPWYNQHKLFAGLRDAWLLAQNEKAKAAYVNLGDWCVKVTAHLDDAKMQRMLAVEHGGMMETLADLYAITGDEKYLALAKRFWHKAVLDPLAAGEDKLTGLHANTQIPKVIAAARLYELTGDPSYRKAAETFWDAVAHRRSYVTGSNSDREHFFDTGLEAGKLGPQTGETCNVYNMLKLTGHLVRWGKDDDPYDYYERALFNHILGSINPDSGTVTYFQALEAGRFKVYASHSDSFWCCVGTGLENHAKYAEFAYGHTDDALRVNLFMASEVSWKDKGITLRQETDFPYSDTTWLTVSVKQPTRLKLQIRVPAWADKGVTVIGVAGGVGRPGEITLMPLADVHHQRYAVYFKMLTAAQFAEREREMERQRAAARELAARTVDEVAFGEQQSEKDHAVTTESSDVGSFNGRTWRDATKGGHFTARLKVRPGVAQALRCTYWGSDGGERSFDILADGKVIGSQTLTAQHPGEFFDVNYPLPATTADTVEIKFQPKPGQTAGGVFGCRVLTATKN